MPIKPSAETLDKLDKLDAKTQFQQNPQQFFEDELRRLARRVGDDLVPGSEFAHQLMIAAGLFYQSVQGGAMMRMETHTRKVSATKVQKALERIKKVQQQCLTHLTPDEKLLVLGSLFGDEEIRESEILKAVQKKETQLE